MIRNFFIITFRNIIRHKVHSAINILGLAFALSVAITIFIYIAYEKSYNKFYANSNRIFCMVDSANNSCSINQKAKDLIEGKFPEIISTFRFNSWEEELNYDQNVYTLKHMVITDPSFFDILSVKFIRGNRNTALDDPSSLVLTESISHKIFGDEDPLGKIVRISHLKDFRVTGVIENFPSNSTIQADALINTLNKEDFSNDISCKNFNDASTCIFFYRIFLMTGTGTNWKQVEQQISGYLKKNEIAPSGIYLVPFKDIYLDRHITQTHQDSGNKIMLNIFMTIAIIILVLAGINYLNLTLAGQQMRIKEIAVKKIAGAQRRQLVLQHLGESVLITFLATDLGLIISKIMLPYFSGSVNAPLNFNLIFRYPYWIWILSGTTLLGMVTGIYPALIVSRYNPIVIFTRKRGFLVQKNNLRVFLNIFQFTISVILLISLFVMQNQLYYVRHKELGFNADRLLKLSFSWQMKNRIIPLHDRLSQYSGIKNLTVSFGIPGGIHWTGWPSEDKKVLTSIIVCDDTSFLTTFGIKIMDGRNFLPGDFNKGCLINKVLLDSMQWDDFHGEKFQDKEVIGIIDNFHFASMHNPVTPLCLYYEQTIPTDFSLRLSGNRIGETMDFIQKTWKEICPEYPLVYEFYDDWFNSMYNREEKIGKLLSVFTILAIIISSLGIWGMSYFSCEGRTKEICIRKIQGARTSSIFFMLSREFILLVFISVILAGPLAWYIMNKWLDNFAYKTPFTIWYFITAGIVALGFAGIAVSYHTLKAALKNPVEALRYE